jgi:3-oxoacyl-[acyl-carrier-protein] synthase III
MVKEPFRISGYAAVLPEKIVENAVLETHFNLESGHIEENFGIKQRYRISSETAIDLAQNALDQSLEKAGLQFGDLDLLISASVSIAYQLPNNATIIAGKYKNAKVPCMDVNMSCLSWLSAFEFAISLLQSSSYKRIAIVSSETPSKILKQDCLESQAIFGDAATAIILEKSFDLSSGKIQSKFETFPAGWDLSLIPGGGLVKHPLHHELQTNDFTFQMENQRLLLFSLKKMNQFFEERKFGNVSLNEIDLIVPHQGSKAGLDYFSQHFKVEEKVIRNFEARGNCVAASIPLAFIEALEANRIQKGQKVLLSGTAAGISIGGILIQI